MGSYSSIEEVVVAQTQATASGGSAQTTSNISRVEMMMSAIILIFLIVAAYFILKRCIARGHKAVVKELEKMSRNYGSNIPMTSVTTTAPAGTNCNHIPMTSVTTAVPTGTRVAQAQVNPAFVS